MTFVRSNFCWVSGLAVIAGLGAARVAAAQDSSPISIVKPGGGYLVADGVSVVPLAILLTDDEGPSIRSARVLASRGKVTGVRVRGTHTVLFYYSAPERGGALDEIIDVALTLSTGNTLAEAFTLSVSPPAAPTVELTVSPSVVNSRQGGSPRVTVTANGERLRGLDVFTDRGSLEEVPLERGVGALSKKTILTLPQLPPDAPSHIGLVAVASGERGFSVATESVLVEAPVRVSVEIQAGSQLLIEGAENAPKPVTAPADGRTVMDGVIVRYGSQVRAFEVRDGKRRELSVILPTGVLSPGVIAPIPEQTLADGGTGPSIVVSIPPSPLGGEPFWPEIEVEGVRLVAIRDVNPRTKVLIVERPTTSKPVRVMLDGIEAGVITFGGTRGQTIVATTLPTDRDERGAVEVVVTDAGGDPADYPKPRVRIMGGSTLPITRTGPGRYRASIPPGTPGKPGDELEVVADIEPPPVVKGDLLENIQQIARVRLGGPPPAIRSKEVPVKKRAPAPTGPAVSPRFGLSGVALVGTSFGSLLVIGGGVQGELRLPWLEHRLALRAGMEFTHASGGGEVSFSGKLLDSRSTIAGFLIPFDAGFAVVHEPSFELLLRVGAALRIEQGRVEIAGNSPGGGSRVGFGARATVEADFPLESGVLFLGATLEGVGATANGLSTPRATLEGSLTNVRAEVGFKFWVN